MTYRFKNDNRTVIINSVMISGFSLGITVKPTTHPSSFPPYFSLRIFLGKSQVCEKELIYSIETLERNTTAQFPRYEWIETDFRKAKERYLQDLHFLETLFSVEDKD